jgi:hypothetical protein
MFASYLVPITARALTSPCPEGTRSAERSKQRVNARICNVSYGGKNDLFSSSTFQYGYLAMTFEMLLKWIN